MNSIDISLRQPALLLALIPALAFLFFAWRRLPGNRHASLKRRLLLLLRCLSAMLSILLLAGLYIVTDRSQIALVVLADRSDSMAAASAQVDAAVEELIASADSETQVAVVNFGAQAQLVRDLKGNALSASEVSGDATDISTALYASAALIPRESRKRVVLLTDGAFTDGDPTGAAKEMQNQGIRLDAVLLGGSEQEAEVQLSDISVPADGLLGKPMQISARVLSSAAMGATLRVSDLQGKISDRQVRLYQGENLFTLSAAPRSPGQQEIIVEVFPEDDTCYENNASAAITHVVTSDAVLLVEGRGEDGSALQALLSLQGLDTHRISVQAMPQTIAELCDYSLLILMNVSLRDLPSGLPQILSDYVTVYGRSLLTSGGEDTYIFGQFKDSALEAILPVDVEVTKTESVEPAALLLLIDNSASMEGTALTMAKRGAIQALESLQENDYAGVITFSVEHTVLAPLMSLERREQIITDLAGLGTVMGTQYSGALLEAERQMNAFTEAANKHIILISDGNPSDSRYEPIIQRMAENGITLTAVAVGHHVSEDIMQRIADIGGGRCYMVESSYDLPVVLLTDTALMQVDYLVDDEIVPVSGDRRYSVPSVLPSLKGYVRTQAKADAVTPLIAPDASPIFALRQSGEGTAACFTSDLSGLWSEAWLQSELTRSLLTGLITDLLPATHGSSALSASLTSRGKTAELTVWDADAEPDDTLTVFVLPPEGDGYSVTLERQSDGRCTHEIPRTCSGTYALHLIRSGPDGTVREETDTAAVMGWSPEYDLLIEDEERAGLLFAMCDITGGEVFHEAKEAALVKLEDQTVEKDLTLPLAWLVFACFLCEMVLRKRSR